MVIPLENKQKETEKMKFKRITTMKVSKQTVVDLSKLKIHPRQSYGGVVVKLLENYKKGMEKNEV